MKRILTWIKETYEQVGPYEYNEINPYQRAISHIRYNYPKAKITQTQTVTENLGALQIPVLLIRYEVQDEANTN